MYPVGTAKMYVTLSASLQTLRCSSWLTDLMLQTSTAVKKEGVTRPGTAAHIPGYKGHVSGLKDKFGSTYAVATAAVAQKEVPSPTTVFRPTTAPMRGTVSKQHWQFPTERIDDIPVAERYQQTNGLEREAGWNETGQIVGYAGHVDGLMDNGAGRTYSEGTRMASLDRKQKADGTFTAKRIQTPGSAASFTRTTPKAGSRSSSALSGHIPRSFQSQYGPDVIPADKKLPYCVQKEYSGHIPGYGGFVRKLQNELGATYGVETRQVMAAPQPDDPILTPGQDHEFRAPDNAKGNSTAGDVSAGVPSGLRFGQGYAGKIPPQNLEGMVPGYTGFQTGQPDRIGESYGLATMQSPLCRSLRTGRGARPGTAAAISPAHADRDRDWGACDEKKRAAQPWRSTSLKWGRPGTGASAGMRQVCNLNELQEKGGQFPHAEDGDLVGNTTHQNLLHHKDKQRVPATYKKDATAEGERRNQVYEKTRRSHEALLGKQSKHEIIGYTGHVDGLRERYGGSFYRDTRVAVNHRKGQPLAIENDKRPSSRENVSVVSGRSAGYAGYVPKVNPAWQAEMGPVHQKVHVRGTRLA